MAEKEAYMLGRDSDESSRLNVQHELVLALCQQQLIHPYIPRQELKHVADIGTGTGIWLQDVAAAFTTPGGEPRSSEYVGFDVSTQQFPSENPPGMDFVVHNTTQPYPEKYHGLFDLVHVRFLSYALKIADLEKAVQNIVQILRPGGYLQWQETDASDSWATPETPNARAMVAYVIAERIARGLAPAIVTPLVRTLSTISAQPAGAPGAASIAEPLGSQSKHSWPNNTLRIMQLETMSTAKLPPSAPVESMKQGIVLAAAAQMLDTGTTRRSALANDPQLSSVEAGEMRMQVDKMRRLVESIKKGEDPASCTWEFEVTWIVARKAVFASSNEL